MRYFIIILCSLTWLIPCAAAPLTHEYTLKNGLKLIVRENHRSPIVISQVWYKVGSAYEPGGITGISHALEHMMFKGTSTTSGDQFNKIITENGGEFNASTSFDYTNYYEVLAADRLPISLKLEADRMQNLTLTDEDFAKEIQVVMEERRLRTDDNPMALTHERLLATAHIAPPYHHTPVGWMSDLQQMTAADLRSWYRTWYAPNNATVVVVGDVQPAHVYQLAERYFGNIPAKSIPSLKSQEEPPALGSRSVTVKRPAKLPYVILAYNVPSLATAKDKWEPYALNILAAALAGDDSARLPKNLIRNQQIATHASAQYEPLFRFNTLFLLSGIPAEHHTVKELKASFMKQLNELQTTPISADELAKIKTSLIASYTYAQDNLTAQANLLGNLDAIGLPWQLADQYIANIQAVTAQQVQQVAKRYLATNRLTTARLIPTEMKGASQ